jgi:hypothetical protein
VVAEAREEQVSAWFPARVKLVVREVRPRGPEDGEGRIVAAAVIVLSGLSDPIISRLKRRGGKLRDLPETLKAELAVRMLREAEQGSSGVRRGLREPPSEA